MFQPRDFFQDLLGPGSATEGLTTQDVLIRMGGALVFGIVSAALHRYSCRYREGAPGLASTLMLLSILIAMVTMAIGDQAAKAFTLVGTLAIVRFRTPVRDIRDTAFVILAVALGLAMGAGAFRVALIGTGLIGFLVMAMDLWSSRVGRTEDGDAWARLELRMDDTEGSMARLESLLAESDISFRLLSARRGSGEPTRLLYSIRLLERKRAAALLDTLHRRLSPKRATIYFEEDQDQAAA